jgi:hypothetical protein
LGPVAIALLFALGADPGIYVWDGVRGAAALERSGNLAAGAGFRAVRLVLSPVSRRTYGLGGERAGSLRALFASEAFQAVLKQRSFHTVMFTAYDFAAYSNQHFLDRAFLTANRQRIFDEYEELTVEIMRRESGSGRVFVIGHWEGDNQVYCGSSYKFLVDDGERAKCLGQNPGAHLEGLSEWLRIRQEAIEAGRERAHREGAAGVDVYHAVEFNSLFHFRWVSGADIRSREYRGVLDTAVPLVQPDVCSYSAWESLNPERLAKDLQVIAKACGAARLVIGELGYEPTAEHRDPTKEYLKAIGTLDKHGNGIDAVFFWEAFDARFGLFGADGQAAWPRAVAAMKGLH